MTKTDFINHDNNAKAKSAQFNSGLPDLNTGRQHRTPLRILLSSRVRLTQEQRETLKAKWRSIRADSAPMHHAIPGSTIKTVSPSQAEERLKTSQLIISDIIASRDSITLATIFELEKLFDVQLVSKEDWMAAAESYFTYVSGEGND